MEQTDYTAVNINRLIARNLSTALVGTKNNDTKQHWAMLKQTGNWGAKRQTVSGIDINQINDYFADIATNTKYSRDEL